MSHYPSSGVPYCPTGDLGEFAPKGEPDGLNMKGGADTKGVDNGEADAALAEFAGIGKKSRISSMPNDGAAADIPKQTSGPSYTSQTKGPEPKGAKGE